MKVFSMDEPIDLGRSPVGLAMGTFDGVHLGHRRLLKVLVERARCDGLQAGVLIPDPHPRSVVSPKNAPSLLTPLSVRTRLIAEMGVDWIAILPFDDRWTGVSPRDFTLRAVVGFFRAQVVFAGFNFTFGHRAAGTSQDLGSYGQELGFEVRVLDPVVIGDRPVSSSRIRSLLSGGDLDGCRELLGRPFHLEGVVVPGDGRGRALGFPTANLEMDPDQALPARGVYAVVARTAGQEAKAVANVGQRPTFGGGGGDRVEVHLLDYSGDLYGENMEVHFFQRLRGERPFVSPDGLTRQVRRDIETVRRYSLCL